MVRRSHGNGAGQSPDTENWAGRGTNVLVTSISQKVPALRAVKDALSRLWDEAAVVGGDGNPNCIGRYFVDRFWEMPRLDKLDVEDLAAYCRENGIGAVIPTRDGELAYFARHRGRLAEEGIAVMVSAPAAVEICLDKLAFARKGAELGFPVIPAALRLEELAGFAAEGRMTDKSAGADGAAGSEPTIGVEAGAAGSERTPEHPDPPMEGQDCRPACCRYVVKERCSSGAKRMGLNLTREAAIRHAERLEAPIYQPFIQGQEISADLYMDKRGQAKGVILRTRDVVVNGESQVSRTFRDERLERLCAEFAAALGLYGHVMFQLFRDAEGQAHFIECNARIGGASTLSLAAGLDSLYWFLAESAGLDLDTVPFRRSRDEKTLIRHKQDLIV